MPTRVAETPEAEGSSSPNSYEASPALRASQTLAVRGASTPRNVSGSKRKRANTTNGHTASHRRRTAEPERDSDGSEASEEDEMEELEDDAVAVGDQVVEYDPDVPTEQRRQIQRQLRGLQKDLTENAEEFMMKEGRLTETIKQSNLIMKGVKRPGEAVTDSRILVVGADLAHRKAVRLTHGSLAQGLDVDEFVSKCITYMRQGRGLQDDEPTEISSTQRRRRTRRDGDDDDEADDGDMMNWPYLGRFAALPYGRRPALPGFLLGPLSVEKKARKVTKRSAPFRPQDLTQTKPELLSASDFAGKRTQGDLTTICASILRELGTVYDNASETVEQAIEANNFSEQESIQCMHNAGLRETGGVDLLRFVVNPTSFGQTIENIFYVSFLIRDGKVAVEYDQHDYPSLTLFDQGDEDEGQGRSGASKHQAVMSMDMETWKTIVDTLELTSPMIPHREEISTQGPGSKGWYS